MRELKLTSPNMRGQDVRQAQTVLRANAFGQDYGPGPADGVFGETTARACKRAKYWLGYSSRAQLPTFADQLHGYLRTGKLPLVKRLRRKRRLAALKPPPMRAKALAEARKHVGEKESPPGSNIISFSNWYGLRGPWCAMFASWCYVQAGSKAFKKGEHYAYVPYIVHDARAGLNGLAITTAPRAGDLVCFDWNRDGLADHVGLFNAWKSERAGTFQTVEGNTSTSSDSDGGQVMQRDRERGEVIAFVHVGR